MLTNEDIKKIIRANKQFFHTKKEIDVKFEEIHSSFSQLQSSVDGLAKQILAYHQEMVMLSNKVNRLEAWIQKVADKVGVKLEY